MKIRGCRVELGEIESVLVDQASIEQAVAVAREDRPGDKSLVAYVRAAKGAEFDEGTLRDSLRMVLPPYMVPDRVVALEAFPVTPNGKVDRHALPRPFARRTGAETEYEPPNGDIEIGLEALLSRLLRVRRVHRHDNLFDIGGTSLLAVSYFNEIQKRYGIRLPVSTLLHAGSIAQLAVEIETRSGSDGEARCLVPIQIEGAKPKFFYVHGAGGNVLFYRDLSARLGNDFPFYGLQARGLDGSSEPLASVEEMAQAYVEEIKVIQVSGPYCLGGYCLGGVIAYEMARLLNQRGDDVALLALLDTYNFARMQRISALSYVAQKTLFHLRNLAQSPWWEWRSYLGKKFQVAREGELKLITRSFFNDSSVEDGSLQDRVHRLNVKAAMRYQPRPFQGVVTNFRPRRHYSACPDPDMGWGGLALTGVRNIELDLNPHAMLVEPFLAQLAESLSHALSVAGGVVSPATWQARRAS